jgi:uncharacterized membrane protein
MLALSLIALTFFSMIGLLYFMFTHPDFKIEVGKKQRLDTEHNKPTP